jgi:hypothetical protein
MPSMMLALEDAVLLVASMRPPAGQAVFMAKKPTEYKWDRDV